MYILLTLGFCIIATIAVFAIVSKRKSLRRKHIELSSQLEHISTYQSSLNCRKETLRQDNERFIVDLKTNFEQCFDGLFISSREAKLFKEHYIEFFNEANNLLNELEIFHITPSITLTKFITDFKKLFKIRIEKML